VTRRRVAVYDDVVPPRAAADVFVPIPGESSGREGSLAAVAIADADARVPAGFSESYLVEEHVQWDRGVPADAVTQLSFVRRVPTMDRVAFARHWDEVHAPLARVHHPAVLRYVQRVVVERLTPGAPDIDGVAELAFATLDDRRHRMYDSPEGRQLIGADVRRFLDVDAGWRLLARRA
jgi:uncharacterized protein (TIGR02118 family)